MPDLARYASNLSDEWSEIGEVFDLLDRRPPFHADAACREPHPGVSWFPVLGESGVAAKRICDGCLVKAECRAWAMAQGPALAGIFGGLSEEDRRLLRPCEQHHHLVEAPGRPHRRRPGFYCTCGRRLRTEGFWRSHRAGAVEAHPEQTHDLAEVLPG